MAAKNRIDPTAQYELRVEQADLRHAFHAGEAGDAPEPCAQCQEPYAPELTEVRCPKPRITGSLVQVFRIGGESHHENDREMVHSQRVSDDDFSDHVRKLDRRFHFAIGRDWLPAQTERPAAAPKANGPSTTRATEGTPRQTRWGAQTAGLSKADARKLRRQLRKSAAAEGAAAIETTTTEG